MKRLLFLSIIVLLVLPLLSFANTYKNLDTGKEFWVGSPNKFFPFFSVTQTQCSALDGSTYTNYNGECRKRFNCKPSSDLSVCGCEITTCDSSSPPPTTTDPILTTCSKSSGSLYVNGGKIASDGCYSGVLTRYECEPSSTPNGYSKSFSSTTYSVYTDGACSSGTTSGSVSYTSVPTSVIKGNKFTVQADIKLDSIAESDCLQTIEGCRLLFEIGAESCPSGNCFSQLKPQAIIPIFAERSACDDSPYWASTTTIVKSGDIVRATFTPLAPSLIGQYKYRVNVLRGCGDKQLPISSGQVSIEVKDGTSPPPETKYFCLSADKKTCTSRLGNCLSDETRFNDGATCEAQIAGGGGNCNNKGEVIGTGTSFINPLKCCEGYILKGLYGFRNCEPSPITLGEFKKLPLTKDDISLSTSSALLASTCELPSECLSITNYTVKCISLAKLKEEGVITEGQEQKYFTDTTDIIKKGVWGASIGSTIGLALCIAGVGAAEVATGGTATPLLIPATASCLSLIGGGALIGTGFSTAVALTPKDIQDDQLLKDLKAKNSNAVGICTKTPIEKEKEGFNWNKFVSSIGKGVNDAFGGKAKTHLENATMGYIVLLVIGIIILMIFTRR